MNTTRKAKITSEHLNEARRLREIWDATPHESQAEFGEKYGIGNQSSVGQFLLGRVPLSLKAAAGFAKGLQCEIADFSPRLDEMGKSLIKGLESAARYVERQGNDVFATSDRQATHLIPVVARDASGHLPEAIWATRVSPEQATGEFVRIGQGSPRSFALEVQGLSMSPRYQPNEFMIVEPSHPPDIEDDVLVRLKTGRTLLRKLASTPTSPTILLSAYNDPAVLSIDQADISWMYAVAHPVPRRSVVHL